MRKMFIKSNLTKKGNGNMRKISLILALTFIVMLCAASSAFAVYHAAFDEKSQYTFDKRTQFEKPGVATGCEVCHANAGHGGSTGPHGGYTSTTTKCATCHTVHSKVGGTGAVATSSKLLPGSTVTDVCNFCHDLTSSNRAPYYTGYMTSQSEVKSAHKVEGLKYTFNGTGNVNNNIYAAPIAGPGTVIPGGSNVDGGTVTITDDLFKQGDLSESSTFNFTCDSCHTPHAINGATVNTFYGESRRLNGKATNRLLKKTLLVDQADPITEYGSAWCAGCHQGRLQMAGSNYNHPVNKDGKAYMSKAIWDANSATVGGAAYYQTNAWYTMTSTDPITGNTRPDGYLPISNFQTSDPDTNGPSCQQCHASPRNVEKAYAYGFSNPTTTIKSDPLGNPWAQSFPHVSSTAYLLVEDDTDTLCTNCHGLDNLP